MWFMRSYSFYSLLVILWYHFILKWAETSDAWSSVSQALSSLPTGRFLAFPDDRSPSAVASLVVALKQQLCVTQWERFHCWSLKHFHLVFFHSTSFFSTLTVGCRLDFKSREPDNVGKLGSQLDSQLRAGENLAHWTEHNGGNMDKWYFAASKVVKSLLWSLWRSL